MRALLMLFAGMVLCCPSPAAAQVRLSFTGDNGGSVSPVAAGTFDEATDAEVRICAECLVGRDLWGGPGPTYFLNVRSKDHWAFGAPDLANTVVPPECANELLFTLQPGDLVIGHVSGGCCDQAAFLHGSGWLGTAPRDYTHLQIDIYRASSEAVPSCRSLLVPIVWTAQPVGVGDLGVGSMKHIYKESGGYR